MKIIDEIIKEDILIENTSIREGLKKAYIVGKSDAISLLFAMSSYKGIHGASPLIDLIKKHIKQFGYTKDDEFVNTLINGIKKQFGISINLIEESMKIEK